jgi:hypothetical protein
MLMLMLMTRSRYAWPALSTIGRVEQALELALQTTAPSYGYQVARGATTLWEKYAAGSYDVPIIFYITRTRLLSARVLCRSMSPCPCAHDVEALIACI